MRLLALFFFILGFAPAHADDTKLTGAWKLVSYLNVDDTTKEEKKLFGEHPQGSLILMPNGRMTVVLTAEGRKNPQTDEDRASALKSMIAYTGKYRIEGGVFINTTEAAWNESWVGLEQKKTYRFEGDRLIIVTSPQPSPNFGGRMMHGVLVWEREK
jgi:hypothetical protein